MTFMTADGFGTRLPDLNFEAFEGYPETGLLLPCDVVVQEAGEAPACPSQTQSHVQFGGKPRCGSSEGGRATAPPGCGSAPSTA